jgi:predicted nucleic acid-binding protein
MRGLNSEFRIIGACALELGYAIGTSNVRDFNRIPGLNIIQL